MVVAVSRPRRHPNPRGNHALPNCPFPVDEETGESRQDEVAALRAENEQLRQAIRSRALIEQAKGALNLRYGLDDMAAFAVLRRWSQDSNVKLHTVAETLVNQVCRNGSIAGADHALAQRLHEQLHRSVPHG